jgi:hypothetical protein
MIWAILAEGLNTGVSYDRSGRSAATDLRPLEDET